MTFDFKSVSVSLPHQLMTKSSEKPRVTQIPSKDMDPAETGPGDGYQRSRQSGTSSTESMWDTESTSSGDYLGDHTMEHTPLMNQVLRHKHMHVGAHTQTPIYTHI